MEFKENKAIYLQIADYLMDAVISGKYKECERIPTVRECAIELEVNVNTCMRAFEWLCQRDVIFLKRGLGYFVSKGAKKTILKEQRKEFFEETVPIIQGKMRNLNISIEELIERISQ